MLPSIWYTCMCDTWVFERYLGCSRGLISEEELSRKNIVLSFTSVTSGMRKDIFVEQNSVFINLLYCCLLNLEERPKLPLSLGTVLMHYSPQWSKIGFIFRLLIWFRVKSLNSLHINMFTERKTTAKMSTVLAFDLIAGNSLSRPGTLREGLHFQCSKKKKRRESLTYVYWTHCIPTYKTFL